MAILRELARDLWVAESDLRFGGVEIGTRMTVICLPDGSLFLHSPIRLGEEISREIEAAGRPRWVVAPNRFHHLFAGGVMTAWPEAELFVAPGLESKRPDLRIAGVLGDDAPEGWKGTIEQVFFRGFPLANEVAFFHPATRTLVLSDLAFNVGAEAPALTRVGMRLLGGYGKLGPTLIEKLAMRPRDVARASLERILAWDFDRVIVAHGAVVESGGRDALRRGYAWLLG